ncbi:chemotaxis protein CheC [Shouchella sp. 1P09AA]|uniref:chemotaxis protein CheC n=1 Tax=unclassified Shouchella TaxID=2893065 RepID=UPI0039A179E9
MISQADMLKEVANISTGYAATALSTLLNEKVTMNVPEIDVRPLEDLPRLRVYHQKTCGVVFSPLEGGILGTIFFLTNIDTAIQLTNKLLPNEKQVRNLVEQPLAQSAFQEVGNIMIGSYLSAIASLTNVKAYPLVTELSLDIGSAVLAEATYHLVDHDTFVFMETTMTIVNGQQRLEGVLIFLPDNASVNDLSAALQRVNGSS